MEILLVSPRCLINCRLLCPTYTTAVSNYWRIFRYKIVSYQQRQGRWDDLCKAVWLAEL